MYAALGCSDFKSTRSTSTRMMKVPDRLLVPAHQLVVRNMTWRMLTRYSGTCTGRAGFGGLKEGQQHSSAGI